MVIILLEPGEATTIAYECMLTEALEKSYRLFHNATVEARLFQSTLALRQGVVL